MKPRIDAVFILRWAFLLGVGVCFVLGFHHWLFWVPLIFLLFITVIGTIIYLISITRIRYRRAGTIKATIPPALVILILLTWMVFFVLSLVAGTG